MNRTKKMLLLLMVFITLVLPMSLAYATENDVESLNNIPPKFFTGVTRDYGHNQAILSQITHGVLEGQIFYSGQLYRYDVVKLWQNGVWVGYRGYYSGSLPGYYNATIVDQ